MLRHAGSLFVLSVLAGCGSGSDDMRELRDGQRELRTKLEGLETKIDQLVARSAAAPAAQQAQQPNPNRIYDLPSGTSPSKGPAKAQVVLVEFSDFQCPFCARVPSVIEEVLKARPDDVKFVFKQFPLTSIHQNALNAAKAALAANKQGKFWEMHDKLFANQKALDLPSLKSYAQEIGLDMAKFEADMNASDVQQQIDDEMKLARDAQVTGTPTLFVNGKRVTDRSVESLKSMIDAAKTPKG